MLTYVLNKDGQPLMPTGRSGKMRRLLRDKKAKVIRRCPFTIQLLYEPETAVVQDITLGVDAGSTKLMWNCEMTSLNFSLQEESLAMQGETAKQGTEHRVLTTAEHLKDGWHLL